MGNLPSNVRMLLDTYEQFAHGLAPVLDAFQGRYDVRVGAAAQGLLVSGGRVAGVQVRYADGRTDDLRGAGVIVATPAHAAAALAEPLLPGLASRLRSIASNCVEQTIFTRRFGLRPSSQTMRAQTCVLLP